MLPEQKIELTWVPKMRKWYEEKGYIYTKQYDKFMVDVKDLQPNSHAKVDVQCDYCGIIYPKKYQGYSNSHKNVDTDSCSKCKSKKANDSNLLLYGVENQFQRQEVKEKTLLTLGKKYGVEGLTNVQQIPEIKKQTMQTYIDKYGEHPLKSDEIIQKRIKTLFINYGVTVPAKSPIIKNRMKAGMVKKYGVEHGMQDPGIRNKIMIARTKTMYEKGNHISSKQQRYLHDLALIFLVYHTQNS